MKGRYKWKVFCLISLSNISENVIMNGILYFSLYGILVKIVLWNYFIVISSKKISLKYFKKIWEGYILHTLLTYFLYHVSILIFF